MNKKFYCLWMTISSSTLGLSLYTMTITVIILSITDSAMLASIVMLFHVFGKLCSSFFFTLLSEKMKLNSILSRALLIQLALYLILTLAVMGGQNFSIGLLLVIIFLLVGCIGFVDGFISPSRKALIPQIVQQEKIAKANSYVSISDQSLALLGWSAAPIALNYYSPHFVLGVSMLLGLLALVSSCLIHASTNQSISASPRKSTWKAMGAGWGILFSKQNHFRTLTLMDILEGIASGIWIGGITLVFVTEILQEGKQWWGYINASYYAGSIMGGIMVALLANKLQKHLTKSIVVGSFAVSILVLCYALNTTAWLALVLVLIMGPFYQLRDISQNTYIQTAADNDTLSKLYAAKDNIYYIVFSLSIFIMGFISDYVGVEYVYYLAGALYLMSSVLAVFSFSSKRTNRQAGITANPSGPTA
ncbi:MFS transporter [Acinetobacter sp. CUI P1]|nr:MFS transporter [Acinetobacter sp. CUI P1]